MKDIRQTLEYAKYMTSLGWIVNRKNGVNYFIKKFPLIGSFIKIQRPEVIRNQEIKSIERLSNKYRAFQIVIEPKINQQINRLTDLGFRLSKSPFVPAKTIHVDLTKSESQLLSEMHYKTRYNIKRVISNSPSQRLLRAGGKLQVTSSKNIQQFADFWQDCARKQRRMFLLQVKEIKAIYRAFGKNAHIILGLKNKELVSGILMIRTKDIAYYMYAASSDIGKKLFAPTLNAWEAIKLAKKLRCKIFDFEGIYDERFPLNSWRGFTRFKKSFGGREIVYPGAFVKYRLPF